MCCIIRHILLAEKPSSQALLKIIGTCVQLLIYLYQGIIRIIELVQSGCIKFIPRPLHTLPLLKNISQLLSDLEWSYPGVFILVLSIDSQTKVLSYLLYTYYFMSWHSNKRLFSCVYIIWWKVLLMQIRDTHVEPTLKCTKVSMDNMSNALFVVGLGSEYVSATV